MKTSTEKLIAEKEGAIGWLIFNNPARHNAMSLEMYQATAEVMEAYEQDDEVRVIVLRGAGDKAFVSGADISTFEKQRASAEDTAFWDRTTEQASKSIYETSKPTIAMINGYCMGGGVSLAMSCDLRIVSEKSRFAVPAAKLGVGYRAHGIRKLMSVVNPAFVKEIFYTARQFSAEEALTMGWVNRVLPEEQLEGYVREYAGTIAGNAPLTIRAVKATVNELLKDPEERDLERSEALVSACFTSEDYVEGRRAFMEKRKPQFKGR
ncbi:MAG TPA: enoyl-CoA hydratase [bacterium]|nr:enoyl-CoA hydratase [bacterium]